MMMVPLILSLTAPAAFAVTLDEALKAALARNETAAQTREQVVQAEEKYGQAKGSILPNVSINAVHTQRPKSDDPAAAFYPERATAVTASLAQPLFRGFREFAGVRFYGDLLRAQKQSRLAALVTLHEQVAASYLDVLAQEQDLRNLNEQRGLYSARVKELETRRKRGESSASEALTAQATAAALDAEIEIAQSRLKTARETFAFVTTLPADSKLEDAADGDLAVKPLAQYLARVEERPDVKSAREALAASDEEVNIAKGGHWPSLDLLGNYYLKIPEGMPEDQKWDVQLKLTLPIFEGGVRQSQVREAASKRKVSELALERTRRKAATDIRSLHDSVRTRADQLKALKNAADIARKNSQVLQREYRLGLSRNIDVQLALTEYRNSRRLYDQARFQARLDVIRLDAAAAVLPAVLAKEIE